MADQTYDEQAAAAEELFRKISEIIRQYRPEDIPVDKITMRMAIVSQVINVSRTTALGALVFAGVYGCLTGLSKAQLTGMLNDLFDAVDTTPGSAETKQLYAQANAEAKAMQQQTKQYASDDHAFGDSIDGVILSPMPKLKQ